MDEMLSISVWVLIIFVATSSMMGWLALQPGTSAFHLDLNGYVPTGNAMNFSGFQNITCTMTVVTQLPAYAYCWIGKVTSPILGYDSGGVHYSGLIDFIWGLLTGWTNLFHLIFDGLPGGDLIINILTPLLGLIELGAIIVLYMRLAAIIRGSG